MIRRVFEAVAVPVILVVAVVLSVVLAGLTGVDPMV